MRVIEQEHSAVTGPAATTMADRVELAQPSSISPVSRPASAVSISAAAAVLLAACGGGGGVADSGAGAPGAGVASAPASGASPAQSAPATSLAPLPVVSTFAFTAPASDEDAARFLLQSQFHAGDATIRAVRSQGYAAWLAAQVAAPASQGGFDWMTSRGYSRLDTSILYDHTTYPCDFMVWNQLMAAPDGMRQRIALALSEFFVLSSTSLFLPWPGHAIAAWWDLLATNAFGNYRTLLEGVTLNPAMGVFLGVRGNRKENLATGRQPDENFGREVMQLFSIGLYQLNLDGTEKRDASGNKIETYSNDDVTNIARVFTGWDLDASQGTSTVLADGHLVPNVNTVRVPMVLSAANHTALASNFLGASIAAGTGGTAALKIALDTLFNHPNVGPFFGKQMIQRLVTSNPSPAYVARVAKAFNANSAGVRGDMAAVFAAVLLDDEARGPSGLTGAGQNGFGKLREPMVRLVQWARTFGVTSSQGSWKIGDLSNPATQLGQSPLRPASVFNFFRPGYVPPSTALSASQTPAPEFQIVNESSVSGYLNYLQGVIRNGIFVGAPELPNNASNANNGFDITAPYVAELALATDAAALVKRLGLMLCAGQLSAANQKLIIDALSATPVMASSPDSVKRDRVGAAVLMVMASSDYLIQK